MKTAQRRIPDLILEQYLLGELPPEEEAQIGKAVDSDPELYRRLKEIEASTSDILKTYPPHDMASRIRDRLEREKNDSNENDLVLPNSRTGIGSTTLFFRRAALPIAAVLVIFAGAFALRGTFQPQTSDIEITRAKGGSSIRVFRKTTGGSEELRDGAVAARRDLIQLGYSTGGLRYGAILSIDGRGTITFHLPQGYSGGKLEAPELDPQPGAMLNFAYELDDAPSFERFFLVLSAKPFSLSTVLDSAKKLAGRPEAANSPLPLGPDFIQQSFMLKKTGGGT
jgi:hypothetical protein